MKLHKITLYGEQKRVISLSTTRPIQIKGVAGSGKSTIAVYRVKHLLENYSDLYNPANVAIFTFNKVLVKYIRNFTREMIPDADDILITNFHSWALELLRKYDKASYLTVTSAMQKECIEDALEAYPKYSVSKKGIEFFIDEFCWIKGRLINDKDEYINTERTGRGNSSRISKLQKSQVWDIFQKYNKNLKKIGRIDFDDYAILLLKLFERKPSLTGKFTHIIIDEAQDLSKAQVLALSKTVSKDTQSITLIADAAQRIYKTGFTWKEVGINVLGSRTLNLTKNYRNTIQIADAARSLLEKDDDCEDYSLPESPKAVRTGDKPVMALFDDKTQEYGYLLSKLWWLKENDNLDSTIILHRTRTGLNEIREVLQPFGFSFVKLYSLDDIDVDSEDISMCSMSSIKGLEFDNVFIVDLNDNQIPLPEGFATDDDNLHISTERRLLYTSMTRARQRLYLLSSDADYSRYLDEIDDATVDVFDYRDI